jgi:hypothetical protein
MMLGYFQTYDDNYSFLIDSLAIIGIVLIPKLGYTSDAGNGIVVSYVYMYSQRK